MKTVPREDNAIPDAFLQPQLPPASSKKFPSKDEIYYIVTHGVMAPSAMNMQMWKFEFFQGRLRCLIDTSRYPDEILTNYNNCESYLAIGAAVENIYLASQRIGFDTEMHLFPDASNSNVVCEISFSRVQSNPEPELIELFTYIPQRRTSRTTGSRVKLNDNDREVLLQTAESLNSKLQLLTEPDEIEEFSNAFAGVFSLIYLSKIGHKYMMDMMRWSAEESEKSCDGMDIKTLELSIAEAANLRLIRLWSAIKLVGNLGGGKGFERAVKASATSSSAMGLLTVKGVGAKSYFHGGRIMQRLWLTAFARGLTFHPWGTVYLFSRLEQGKGDGLSENETQKLSKIRDRYLKLFKVTPEHTEILLFRIIRPNLATSRSLRRRIEDVLSFK